MLEGVVGRKVWRVPIANSFPVFLKVQPDGSTTTEVRKFEDFITTSMGRPARSASAASPYADRAFNFAGARKSIRMYWQRFSKSLESDLSYPDATREPKISRLVAGSRCGSK